MPLPRKIRFLFFVIFALLLLRIVEAATPNMKYGRVFYKIGLGKEKKRKNDKAIKYYLKAIQSDPALFEAYGRLGQVYMDKEEYDKAITYGRTAVYLNPEYHQGFTTLGFAYRGRGNYQKALTFFEKANALYPHYPYAPRYVYNVGKAYLDVGDNDSAVNALDHLRSLGETQLADALERLMTKNDHEE